MGRSPLPMIEYKDFSLRVHTQAVHTRTVVNAQIELTYGCKTHSSVREAIPS